MKRIIYAVLLLTLSILFLSGCQEKTKSVKIGVSMGAGAATRWDLEKDYMLKRAEELGIEMDMRLNRHEQEKSQKQDCIEMIDSGIDVLIIMPRQADAVKDILDYAAEKKVPVISYARVIFNGKTDLFVGYDSERIGQRMGQFIAEDKYEGDYIILRGDENDNNATLIYNGAMRYIDPIKDKINIILDTSVTGWDPQTAKELVLEAITNNNGKIDAILSPNDKIAGACAEALAELNIETPVTITGMDADIDALKRIIAGTQSMTVYMSFEELAVAAVNEAYNIATGAKVNVNAQFDNQNGGAIPSSLITGQVITKENIDRVLIDSGHYTREEIYGSK